MSRTLLITVTVITVIVLVMLLIATERGTTVPTSAPPDATVIALSQRSLFIPPEVTLIHTDAIPDAPITTAERAEQLSLPMLPDGVEPTVTIVKLLSRSTYEQQFHSLGVNNFNASLGPVWIVAFLANGLTGESIDPPPVLSTPAAPAVPGAYYAWDANSATLDAMGALRSTGPKSFGGIADLPDETPLVEKATAVP